MPMIHANSPATDGRSRLTHWRLSVAVAALALLLQTPAHAKPIDACLNEADASTGAVVSHGAAAALCESPPQRFSTDVRVEPAPDAVVQIARVTLDSPGDGQGVAPVGSVGGMNRSCAELRGAHEAQSTLLQSIQRQMHSLESQQAKLVHRVQALRINRGAHKQLAAAKAQLSRVNSVLGATQKDFLVRSDRFNYSMNKLTKACSRG